MKLLYHLPTKKVNFKHKRALKTQQTVIFNRLARACLNSVSYRSLDHEFSNEQCFKVNPGVSLPVATILCSFSLWKLESFQCKNFFNWPISRLFHRRPFCQCRSRAFEIVCMTCRQEHVLRLCTRERSGAWAHSGGVEFRRYATFYNA